MRWGGVLEEPPSPFLCLLAGPVPSSLASPAARPLEPELGAAPQLRHRQKMGSARRVMLQTERVSTQTQLVHESGRRACGL